MRSYRFPPSLTEPVWLFRSDALLKAHPDYTAAKSGDAAAAVQLVMDLAEPLRRLVAGKFSPDAIFVAPHASEATGDNAIPQVLARAIANLAGGQVDLEIVQRTRVFHTGADPMERLNSPAQFDGPVQPDSSYVLYPGWRWDGRRRCGNGECRAVGAFGAAAAGSSALQRRFGDAIRQIFGIDPAALTAEEAQYLIGFRTADEIRNRSLAAKQETNRRLRARGVDGMGGAAR